MTSSRTCPISNLPMRPLFRHRILSKYDVQYFHCEHCGLIQTEDPYWLSEAYQSPIAALDTGILDRNIKARHRLEPMIELLSMSGGRFVDVGGGYGTLTRLMRDIGYDCSTLDPYCQNIFAKDFEAQSGMRYDALFAFEILEHIIDPIDFLRSSFSTYSTKTVLFSTITYQHIPDDTWWYYAFESGQHISFYHQKTLTRLAEELGCTYYRINSSMHLITDRKIGLVRRMILTTPAAREAFAIATRFIRRNRTKTFDDYEYARAQMGKTASHSAAENK